MLEKAEQPAGLILADIERHPEAPRGLRTIVRDDWPWLLAVVVACLAARLPWMLVVHAQATSDSYFYVTGAASIAAGHGYSIMGHPTAFFPIGWPAFLAALFTITGESWRAVEVLNLVLWSATTVLVYLLGERLGGRRAAFVAALIIALEPNMAIYVLRASSEYLFIPLVLAACLLLVWRPAPPTLARSVVAGVLLGAAMLVRSTAILAPAAIVIWLLLRDRRAALRTGLVVCAVAYVALVPWVVRNMVVMKTFALSTNGGYTLWLGDNPQATGGNAVLGVHPPWPITSAAAEVRGNNAYTAASLRFITHDTGEWLRLIPEKLEALFRWTPGPFHNIAERQPANDPAALPVARPLDHAEADLIMASLHNHWLIELSYRLYWELGAVALLAAAFRRRPGASLALTLVALWVVFHVTLVHGQMRYMMSVAPLVAPALGWMLVAGPAYVKARIRSQAVG